MGAKSFKKTAGDILRGLRSSRLAPKQERIYTAGEKEYLAWLDRKDKGVPLGDEVKKEFIEVRNNLELDFKFTFE